MPQSGSGGSAGVRDEMAWKNVFEKTLRQMFVAQQTAQTPSASDPRAEGQYGSPQERNYTPSHAREDLHQQDKNSPTNRQNQDATSSAKPSSSREMNSTIAEANANLGMTFGTPMPSETSKSESAAVRSQQSTLKTFVDNQERLHIAKTADGVNVSIRLNGAITENAYALVRQVLKQFQHLDIAVYGIKINGKQITIDQLRVEEIWR